MTLRNSFCISLSEFRIPRLKKGAFVLGGTITDMMIRKLHVLLTLKPLGIARLLTVVSTTDCYVMRMFLSLLCFIHLLSRQTNTEWALMK